MHHSKAVNAFGSGGCHNRAYVPGDGRPGRHQDVSRAGITVRGRRSAPRPDQEDEVSDKSLGAGADAFGRNVPSSTVAGHQPAAKLKRVRGLMRGLQVLRALNEVNHATVVEISRRTGLSRGTVYRLLDTLIEAGYVAHAGSRHLYRLTIMVRTLSDGFDDEAWVSEIASPVIAELGRKIVWPTDLATFDGNAMVVRETTHLTSPLSITRSIVGQRITMLFSSLGHAYLAFCPKSERDAILRDLAAADTPEGQLARKRAALDHLMTETRKRGYGFREGGLLPLTGSIAVPVMWRGRPIACINMHYILSALSRDEVVERYLGHMREAASRIEKGLAEGSVEQTEAMRVSA